MKTLQYYEFITFTHLFLLKAKLSEEKENRQKCKSITQTLSMDSEIVLLGIKGWQQHFEEHRKSRVDGILAELNVEKANLKINFSRIIINFKILGEVFGS